MREIYRITIDNSEYTIESLRHQDFGDYTIDTYSVNLNPFQPHLMKMDIEDIVEKLFGDVWSKLKHYVQCCNRGIPNAGCIHSYFQLTQRLDGSGVLIIYNPV